MGFTTAGNSYLGGIHKQTNESTVGTVAAYSLPVTGATIKPKFERRSVAVTDAQAIQGDTYKGPAGWGGSITFVAQQRSLGRFLQSIWPTDTVTGAGPFQHAFSGLGNTRSWMAFFARWPGAANYMLTFGKGVGAGISFTSSGEGGPLLVTWDAEGQGYVQEEAHTVTTAETLADGYFMLQASGSYIRADLDTPNVAPASPITNVQSITIGVTAPVSGEPTADSATVTNMAPGIIGLTVSMEWLWTDWQAFKATYFGSVAGTSLSSTTVTGALELLWKHSTDTNASLKLYVPAMAFDTAFPEPNTDGSPLKLTVTGQVHKPTSGDHLVPTLTNSVSAAY